MVQEEGSGLTGQTEEGIEQNGGGLRMVHEETEQKTEGLKEVLSDQVGRQVTPEMVAVSRFAQYVGSLSDLYGGIKKQAVMAAVEREMLASQQYLRQILAGVIESYVKDEE